MPDLTRAFIAIELPAPVLDTLGSLQERLGGRGEHAAKWVSPRGIHLTLKFLGDVPTGALPAIGECMARAAAGTGLIALHLSGAGCFPSPERPRVIWVGLEGDVAALSQLQRSLEDAMAGLGYPRESRGFTPHLTLARIRDVTRPEDRMRLGTAAAKLVVPRVEFQAGDVALIRSELRPAGAVYTCLRRASIL